MINKYTHYLLELIKKIAILAKDNNKKYFIGQGWAIDLFHGKITRNHDDIDFHPEVQDLDWWKEWFISQNLFYISRNKLFKNNDYPDAYKFFNRYSKEVVDLWPFVTKENELYINYCGNLIKAKQNLSKIKNVIYENIPIYIEDPYLVIEFKTVQYKKNELALRDKDIHDFEMMGFIHPSKL